MIGAALMVVGFVLALAVEGAADAPHAPGRWLVAGMALVLELAGAWLVLRDAFTVERPGGDA